MSMSRLSALTLVAVLWFAGCASPAGQPSSGQGAASQSSSTRTLIMTIRGEPLGLADRVPRGQGGRTSTATIRPWNARLVMTTEREDFRPYLAESLPELNTNDWRVFPDGRMETTYRLRPNITWHDGALLSGEDFVFAWQVYVTPLIGEGESPPYSLIEEVRAPDNQTVLIRWKRPYAEAGELGSGFPPLPRHILQQPFQTLDVEAFSGHAYWAQSFVGLGPYRLDHWEPGAFIDGVGFDHHVLGRPQIDRIRFIFLPDPNTVVANLLAGAAHIAVDDSVRFEQGYVLQQQWAEGKVVFSPTQVRYTLPQLKADFARPKALLDLRFRKALMHAADKQALVDGLLQGVGTPADTLVVQQARYYPDIDKVIAKYPRDLRRTEQLLAEVGYTKGPDGNYAHPTEGKIDLELWAAQGSQNEGEITILASTFSQIGIPSRPWPIPQAQATDGKFRAEHPGLQSTSNIGGFDPPLSRLRASQIPAEQNRWRGSNRAGYNSPTFEPLVAAYDSALARSERDRLVVEMMRVVSEELPAFPLYFNVAVVPHHSDLQGILVGSSSWSWNIYEWSWAK